MFLGKKGESMPASANSAMHGAYSAQCIFGMLLDSVCGSRRMGFLKKRWQFFLELTVNTLNFVKEVKLQNRHEPVKGSIFFKYFCMWLLLSAIGLILHRMTIWAPPRDLKISSLTPWCETGKNLAFHYGQVCNYLMQK